MEKKSKYEQAMEAIDKANRDYKKKIDTALSDAFATPVSDEGKEKMNQNKTYICNKDFPNLGLEIGDYFPTERFTKEAIEDAIKKGKIVEEVSPSTQKESGWDWEVEFDETFANMDLKETAMYRGNVFEARDMMKDFILKVISSEHQKAAQRIALLEREVGRLKTHEHFTKLMERLSADNPGVLIDEDSCGLVYYKTLDAVLKLLTDKK